MPKTESQDMNRKYGGARWIYTFLFLRRRLPTHQNEKNRLYWHGRRTTFVYQLFFFLLDVRHLSEPTQSASQKEEENASDDLEAG